MQMRHHIHFHDQPEECTRLEFKFDPPVDMPSFIGDDFGKLYAPFVNIAFVHSLKPVPSVVSKAGILHITEEVALGSVVSFRLREGQTLRNLELRADDHLLVIPTGQDLILWVTAGKSGLFVMTAQVVDDKGDTWKQFMRNQPDLPLRDYLTSQMRRPDPHQPTVARALQDVMTHKEAAAYLGIGASTLYRKVAEGLIRRSPGMKFRKSDLDDYLGGKGKRIRRVPKK